MTTRVPVALLLRVGALALALTAAIGPHVGGEGSPRHVVLVDVSAGCDSSGAYAALVDAVGRHGTARLATFGDGVVAAFEGRAVGASEWRGALPPDGGAPSPPRAGEGATDLAAALRYAASLGDGRGGRLDVVVVGDGRATSGREDLIAAAGALRRAGCSSLSFVSVPQRDLGARITAVRGPGRARWGSVFGVVVEGVSSVDGSGVALVRDGRVLVSRVVPAGPFRIAIPVRAESGGQHVFEARMEGAAPFRPPRADVVVGDPGRALLLTDGAPRPGLVEALGERVDRVTPEVLDTEASLATHDVVIVDGAPPPDVQSALVAWVARGGGVVLLDGPESAVGLGGPLAAAAPLRARPPDDPGIFLYVAVDGSGSMAERWPGSERARDDVVRSAVTAVLASQPADVTVALRRFDDRLRPVGTAPWSGRPAGDVALLRSVVLGWSEPGGGTVLAPVLAEAARLAAARPERTRHALVFTDGRFADEAADVATAADALRAAGCGLAVVVDSAAGREAVLPVLGGADADVLLVDDAVELTSTLRAAAAPRLGDLLRDAPVALTRDGELVPGLAVPPRVAAALRRFPSPDATTWCDAGTAPLAAVRRHGAGRMAALATRPADPAFLVDGPEARSLVGSLRAWVERPSGGEVRLESDGERLLVRAPGLTPTHVELAAAAGVVRRALQPAAAGLLAARLPSAVEGGLVRLLDGDRELAACGLDRPAVPELVRERAVDKERLAGLAVGSEPPDGVPLRPWLAALAVLALLASQLVAVAARRARSDRGAVALP